jgi:hypothetical protein
MEKCPTVNLQCYYIQQNTAFQGTGKLNSYTRQDLERIRNNHAATGPRTDDNPAYHPHRVYSNNLL